jgi:uncharacterized membrane protein
MSIKSFIVSFIIFLAIDAVWLGVVARKLYKNQIGHLMASKPNFVAALVFYLIFIFGLVYFVIDPALADASLKKAIINGLLFGFITYSTYDLTNLATLREWPIQITIIDLIWGTSLGGSVSTISYLILNKI